MHFYNIGIFIKKTEASQVIFNGALFITLRRNFVSNSFWVSRVRLFWYLSLGKFYPDSLKIVLKMSFVKSIWFAYLASACELSCHLQFTSLFICFFFLYFSIISSKTRLSYFSVEKCSVVTSGVAHVVSGSLSLADAHILSAGLIHDFCPAAFTQI